MENRQQKRSTAEEMENRQQKRSTAAVSDGLVFEVNGERFEVGEVDASTTLLEFLRSATPFKSVKLGCGEGGCGACVVLLSKYDPELKQLESCSVSSCLTLLCSVNGCSITTSEGLGNSREGFHPIHQRFAGFHASQCGFCTPGMCISLFSALASAEKKKKKFTVAEAERAVAGNLCRCTGYRPIADVCKSFAADVDLEDLGMSSFWRSRKLPSYNVKDHVLPYVEVLNDECKSRRVLNSERHSWATPVTVEELRGLLDMARNGARVKLVVGNTGTGYYSETEKYDRYVDLRYIPELCVAKRDESGIVFGAALPISKAILYLKEEGQSNVGSGGLISKKIAEHMEKIASGFVRNSASVGGNLIMAQRKCFPSDIATLLLAVGSTVTILIGHEQENITVAEFLNRPPLDSKHVLLSIHIPFLENGGSVEKNDSRLVFETYRAAPRPLGNALPYLNAAFLADIRDSENGCVVNRVRLVFGAYGTRHAVRASGVEQYLEGKTVDVRVLDEAIRLVKKDVVSEDGTSHAGYRTSLAVGFLFSFLITFLENHENGSAVGKLCLLSSGKQFVESSRSYSPVGEPMPKFGAAIQASGEAVFVDDIPSPPNCLHGALVCSTKPLARVKGVSFEPNLEPSGVVDVISVKDIPKGGENVGATAYFGPEPLFADGITTCAGDVIAFVVAETQKQANFAARMALVDYDSEGLDPPILTVEEAVEKSSFFDAPPHLVPEKVGDFLKGMAEADHKILSAEIRLGSQYCFYMETQSALAIPDEDNCMVVYSAVQCPEYAHTAISRCLGVPENNVRVITRRLGGGFGGKALKAMTVATACAVAASKLQRPVRSYVERKTDMIIAGGRHPMKITYNVGFKSNGKITALHLDVLMNAGVTVDFSPFIPQTMISGLKKYNWGALSFDVKLCKTNHSSKSTMRAPGDVQGSHVAEAILEAVASVLSMEVDSVRETNLHSYESLELFYAHAAGDLVDYTLPSIWDKVANSSRFLQRAAVIHEFNCSNMWCKRGISRVPIVYEVGLKAVPGKVSVLGDGSVVVEVGGVEMGQGLWTKVRQMAAFALSKVQCDGTEDLVERVRVVQSDTLSLVQGGLTSGSTTSEASCAAVGECCDALVQRLSPLVKKLQEEMGSLKWADLILQAQSQSINLAVNSYSLPESSSLNYLNYGAAVSEVEVNVLTGETTILRTDIIYDCGQSLNPAVDLGQIEGAFVQGLGFFMLEEFLANEDGLVITDSTWTYKIPTLDTIPKQFHVELLNSGHHRNRVLSSKACGEAPLLLAASVHCAVRAAIVEARKQLKAWGGVEATGSGFVLDVPATLPVVKRLCGLDSVELYLHNLLSRSSS